MKFKAVLPVLALLVLIFPNSALAWGFKDHKSGSSVEVEGYVGKCGEAVPYVQVTASCGSQSLSGLTGSTGGDNGKYSLTFNNSSCVVGSPVFVHAMSSGQSFSASGTIGNYLFVGPHAYVDVETGSNCSTSGVPEFGMIPGMIAASGAAGSFFFLRRRVK